MTGPAVIATLESRAAIAVGGPDWRDLLQGLVTQDVASLADGEIRFGALLTPQGRLLFDLFFVGRGEGCLIDCAADRRDALVQRLALYRLRAKVEIAPSPASVLAAWSGEPPAGFLTDPRAPGLGWRGYGASVPAEATVSEEAAYEGHRLALGIPGTEDWGEDATYPIEANFDLLNGIDFRKGCFVGQETTSRMKRRGQIRSRMAPISFDGPTPAFGSELLAGNLRAGEVRGGRNGVAIASLRLDRLAADPLTFGDGHSWRPVWPDWLAAEAAQGAQRVEGHA
jgi:folate-binding protein YgfZ